MRRAYAAVGISASRPSPGALSVEFLWGRGARMEVLGRKRRPNIDGEDPALPVGRLPAVFAPTLGLFPVDNLTLTL